MREFEKMIFLGNGSVSVARVKKLKNMLDYGLSMLGALQQPDHPGDAEQAKACKRTREEDEGRVEDVARDVVQALTGKEFDFVVSDLADICKTFQQELAVLADRVNELRGSDHFGDTGPEDKIIESCVWSAYHLIDTAKSNFGNAVEAINLRLRKNEELNGHDCDDVVSSPSIM